ncbi:MAG TPA: hypothetical protein VMU78_00140 [Methylocella sp.]|nr:hypothetical protein [Methylocella sp.]
MIHEYIDLSEGFPDEDDVHDALAFLVSIEPAPPPPTYQRYKAAIAPYETQIDHALGTLRTYASQLQPTTLEDMRGQFRAFANDPHYLTSIYIAATVTAYLNEAWDGIGPWQR